MCGSIRQTVPSPRLVTHTPVGATATAFGSLPTWIVSDDSLVAGSMRTSRPLVVGSTRRRLLRKHVGEKSGGEESEDDGCDGERPTPRARLLDAECVTRVCDELDAARVAGGGVLVERPTHDSLESGWRRRWRLLEVGEENGGLGTAVKGGPTRQALVEEAGERVLVGASVDVLPLDLFGRDVRGRSERDAGVEARRLLRESPGEPEVREIDMAPAVEQDIRRLDVAVYETLPMRGVECVSDLRADRDRPARVQLLLVSEQHLQIAAVCQTHDEVELPVDLAGVVDRDDVRMLE